MMYMDYHGRGINICTVNVHTLVVIILWGNTLDALFLTMTAFSLGRTIIMHACIHHC